MIRVFIGVITSGDVKMDRWLSVVGVILTLIGTVCLVWYDAFAKFEGQTHGRTAPFGGGGTEWKLRAFSVWEKKRGLAIKLGLVLVVLGAAFEIPAIIR
ncbi:hypothetical protein HFQ13_06705 [Acidithiobacillus sp. VAN18-1]|uniref:Uncharacterized protein n=1 Tax=Igneacidithiobacillus copahuensis TaxID=2724909 RepID=A0AAE3CJM0_9PROT|nr:hypothetical protein [Igneacidithiobacillus copahuensis]MBU2787894.1 hypothetical protein [Igneacidithiobacillus copahuensis]